MSSNCPPQLQLSLQPSTTSFKRSFEQFGFDLESPGGATDAGGSGANNGNDRNKRARSASSFSEGSDSMESSTITSGSSGSSPSRHGGDAVVNEATTSPIAVLGPNLSTHSALEPPRLPTPDIQDIEMPDYPMDGASSESFADSLVAQVSDSEDRYRLSLDRYNPFHTEMSALRQPQSISPLVPRSPTPPPVLPPLYISEDQTRLSTSTIPFLHPQSESHSTTSHAGSFFNSESPSNVRPRSPTTNRDNSVYEEQGQGRGQEHNSLFQNEFQRDSITFSLPSNRLQSNNIRSSRPERRTILPSRHPLSTSNPAHFREHLNSALDHLRSPSPLVPGLEDVGEEASLPHSHVNTRISRALPNPPTLPPIVTDTDNDNWNQNSPLDIFAPRILSGPSRDTSSFTSPTTNFGSSTSTSSSGSLDLGDHPLPSPRLHDLRSWMDASSSGSSHSWDVPPLSTSSVNIDSMRDSSDAASNQGTFATSSTGQSRAGHEYTASLPQQPTSLSPSRLASPPLRNWRFMRMSDLEGNRREWPSASTSTPTSTSISISTSISQADSDSQPNTNTPPTDLPLLSFNRRSADEAAVRSLDQGFDSSLSFSARPSPPLRRSLSYAERFRLHEPQLADVAASRGRVRTSNGNISDLLGRMIDEGDTGDLGLTNFQTNTTAGFAAPSRSTFLTNTLERLHSSRENLSGLLGRRVDELDSGNNGSARLSSPSQATSTDSRLNNSTTAVESRTGFNNSRDLYLRNRLRSYGAPMIRPGASNSLVSESAVEARRRADRIEVLERVYLAGREGRRDSDGSVGGGVGESFDAQVRNAEADLRENGMSSIGWDPAPLNRRPPNDLEAREDSRRLQEWTPNQWNHASWRQPPNVNHRPSYLPFPEPILPLPGLSSNDDMDMMIGESIGFRPTDFTSRSALSTNNTRNDRILPSSLYDNPGSSRTTSRSSDYFWLNSSPSRPAPSDKNSMDTSVSPELPSAPETDIFDSRFPISDIVGTSSTSGVQRRHSASSDSSHSDSVNETRPNQPYLGDPPSLPPPDLGGVFDAERHASSIAISDESPETILVHPPQRSLGDNSETSRASSSFLDRPPPSIPIQDGANSLPADNVNIRISYADIRQRHQALLTSELDAISRRQRRSQFESRRISALAEEIRGLGGSPGNNPVTNSTRTQAPSVGDLQRPSTLGQGNRSTIEPTERRNHSRSVPATAANSSELPFARYQGLDPASFTPGPFRNTVQQLFNERRHTQRRPDPSPSVPPTIPPLSFEDTDLSSLHQRILLHQLRRPTETAETVNTSNRDMVDERLRRERAIERMRAELLPTNRRMPDRPSAARGVSVSSESSRRREQSDIHRYLTRQQLRMEASRIEDPEAPVSSSRSGGDIQGLSHAIDVLRHDGLSTLRQQQLIERFRREREPARTRNAGTETESTPATNTPSGPPGGPRRPDGRRFFMRRETGRTGDEERRSAFSSAAAQHINQEEQRESEELAALGLSHSMRGRRGRFPRVPPEVIYSFGRQVRRGGTFGDYMRDEDFDESYEGLLSLSATLGDVKPKSTPASIISGLETAQYKDWATSESDQRCPICLDDYQPTDQVLKLNNCSHWLHKDCLHQWLQGARTCPVCRKSVYPTSQASPSSRRPHPRHSHPHYPFGGPNPSWRRDHPPPPPPPPGGGVLDPV